MLADSLLAMADGLALRADSLSLCLEESRQVIARVLEAGQAVISADTEIDRLTAAVLRNTLVLADFQTLYERAFYLESNLHMNDSHTNRTSYGNLNSEFKFLSQKFDRAHSRSGLALPESDLSPDPAAQAPAAAQTGLQKMLSISNINLRPLRCKSTRVSKKKSKYKLLEAYTLNPLQLNPTRDVLASSANTNLSNIMESSDLSAHLDLSPHTTMLSLEDNTLDQQPACVLSGALPLFGSFTALDIDNFDLDSVAVLEHEPASPTPTLDDFENFHHYLRKSRIDLRQAFPEPLTKARSHDSVLSLHNLPAPTLPLAMSKFHNPLDMVKFESSISTTPTVEAIYSKRLDSSVNFREHSRKLLSSNPILSTPAGTPHSLSHDVAKDEVHTPTKKKSHGFFQLLNSPLGSPRGFVSGPIAATPNAERRNSVDIFSKSFANNIMNLMGTSAPKAQPDTVPSKPVLSAKKSPPEKIKRMKKDINNPISVNNEIHTKRLPRKSTSFFPSSVPDKHIFNHTSG